MKWHISLLLGFTLLELGCSGLPTIQQGSSTGGSDVTGDTASTGELASGGASTGGLASGGASTGGLASGDASTGGLTSGDYCSGSGETPHNRDRDAGAVVISALAAGDAHTCALVQGEVECWGINLVGQLGNGTTTSSCKPVQVQGLTSVSGMCAGSRRTCAIANGAALCWGDGGYGYGGVGVPSNSSIPVQIPNLTTGVTAIASGLNDACAIVDGGVQCWGTNGLGQLGIDMSTKVSWNPVPVPGFSSDVSALSVGESHACAILNGGLQCWGENSSGQLGSGVDIECEVIGPDIDDLRCYNSDDPQHLVSRGTAPVQVLGLTTGVAAVAAGGSHTCAIVNGAALCWGRSYNGQLGNGHSFDESLNHVLSPDQVQGLTSNVTAITAGGMHTCAIVNEAALCWGYNKWGQLGDNTTTDRLIPTQVQGLTSGVTAIAAGSVHTCAVVNGVVKCWGRNSHGQLGDGTTTDRSTPVDVIGL